MSTDISERPAIISVDRHDTPPPTLLAPAGEPDTAKHTTGHGGPRLTATVRWVILIAVALAVLLSGCTATTTGQPAAAPDLGRWQPPAILPQHLADLLLKENDVNTIARTPPPWPYASRSHRCGTTRTWFPTPAAWTPTNRPKRLCTKEVTGRHCKDKSLMTRRPLRPNTH